MVDRSSRKPIENQKSRILHKPLILSAFTLLIMQLIPFLAYSDDPQGLVNTEISVSVSNIAATPVEQFPILSGPEAAGIPPLTGDVNLWAENGGGRRDWQAGCAILSNGNAIVLGGMRKDPGWSGNMSYEATEREMRDMIAIFSPTGELIEPARPAFYTDAGEQWERTICTHRTDDKFYYLSSDTAGGRSGPRYLVHSIANPEAFPEAFPGYLPENSGEYHTVIQVIGNDGIPESKLINPWGEYIQQRGLIRGGIACFLSNGNIVINFEDRTTSITAKAAQYGSSDYRGYVVGAIIVAPDGRIIKPPFAICTPSSANSQNRCGLTAGDGWFVVRYQDGIDGPTLVAFDNDGNELGDGQGRIYPAIDIPELEGPPARLRGDAQDLDAVGDLLFMSTHRRNDYKGLLCKMRVDEHGITVLKTIRFIDHPRSDFKHNADIGVDSAGNIIVMWEDQSWERFQGGRWEMLARMFDVNLEPLTPSFCIFEIGNNTNIDEIDPLFGPGRTKQCRISMSDEIIIAVAPTNEPPYGDPEPLLANGSEAEWYAYTYIARLLKNPFGASVIKNWDIY